MKRFCHWIAIVGLCAATTAACSNYRDDLDRAASHYNRNQYENALALLQPLELDVDSLSDQERSMYAYYRGMSHFRLNQRREARHWLALAAAGEKAHNGSLGTDEQKRVTDTLDELNRAVYGLAESAGPSGRDCKSDADCDQGQFCDAKHCTKTPGAGDADKADGPVQPAGAAPEAPTPPASAPTTEAAPAQPGDI